MKCITLVGALSLAYTFAFAQLDQPGRDDTLKPWEDWEPPAIEMPDPNAFELYALAFDLYDRISTPTPAPPPQNAEGQPMEEAAPAPDPGFGRFRELETSELRELCENYAPVFRLLEEAIAGEAQFPAFEEPAQQFTYFTKIRQAARMFAARSQLRREEDRMLEAALDAIACVHLGADVMTQGSLISGLVGIACQAIGHNQLAATIPELDATGARAAIVSLRRAMAQRAGFAEVLAGEETFVRLQMIRYFPQFGGLDEATKMLREDPDFARQMLAVEDPEVANLDDEALAAKIEEKIAQIQALTPEASWVEMDRFFTNLNTEAAKPYWARQRVEPPVNVLLSTLLPIFERAGLKFAVIEARLRVALTALAAQAYWVERGNPPTSLEVLVPDYLPEMPRDPFADAPLRLNYTPPVSRAHPAAPREPAGDGVLMIYSVGPDGDDDGGEDIGTRIEPDADGDIAFMLVAG